VQSGSYQITFIATDNDAATPLSCSETITLTVADTLPDNYAPTVSVAPILTLARAAGSQIAVVTDPDAGDSHTLSIKDLPLNGGAFLLPGDEVYYAPSVGRFGTDVFTITATDKDGATGDATVDVTVEESTSYVAPDLSSASVWLDPLATAGLTDTVFADLDGDGNDEVITLDTVTGQLTASLVLEGGVREELWRTFLDVNFTLVTASDVDSDGSLDVVLPADGSVLILIGDGLGYIKEVGSVQ
jgi:hypothetical protein